MTWRPLERAVGLAILALWLACFALSVRDVARATAWSPLHVGAAVAGAYPEVVGFRLAGRADGRPLVVGDRLVAIGETDLRGGGPIAVSIGFSRFHGTAPRVPVRFERDGSLREATLTAASRRVLWPRLVAAAVFAGAAAFLLAFVRPSRLARTLFWGYLSAGLFFACIFSGEGWIASSSIVVHVASLAALLGLNLWSAFLFPDEERRLPGWLAAVPAAFALLALADSSRFYAWPWDRETGAALTGVGGTAYFAVALGAVAWNYHVAPAARRRQMRWFLLGCSVVAGPIVASSLVAAFEPGLDAVPVVALSLAGFLPVFLLIGVLRSNFLDVDRVISAAATTSLLLFTGLALMFTAGPALAEQLQGATGLPSEAARVAVAVALAAVALALYRRTAPWLDRALYPERLDLEQGLEQLITRLGECAEAGAMSRTAGEGLVSLFQPLRCALYVRAGDRFEPAFARGPRGQLPEVFAVDDPLVATIGRAAEPIATEELEPAAQGGASMEPFDFAVLQKLDVPLVVPVRRDGELVAFATLGRKRSGDVYTRTDRTLLAIAADKISSVPSPWSKRESRERLQRYVPGSLVEELDRGHEPDIGRAIVTVLFVDLRGYTSFTELRAPEEVFETINRYTGLVSAAIRDHGGTIVEFNGDGMMAVFGAPQPLERAAASAVEAARTIVGELAPERADAAAGMAVGIGIATGPAFVGNVRAVDRWIWTALGNTTNLAARLQAATVEFATPLLVDERTFREAGAAPQAWTVHEDVRIRGRRRRERLYAFESGPASAPPVKASSVSPRSIAPR